MGKPIECLTHFDREEARGVSRRDFVKICTMAAASLGLPAWVGEKMAQAAAAGKLRPSVVWLHFQECTGCTETLLRTTHPALAELILDLISLDYHETVSAAAGDQIEENLKNTIEANAGKFICVIEGAIPTKDNGIYCKIGGRTALEIANEVAEKAAAIIAIGSCASFGGLAAADPNPTGAAGAPQVLKGKPVVTIPGCPPNPYNFLGVALQYATLGSLPALDELGRPAFAYARTIHEDCPRRPHFDAGRFAEKFGDQGHRDGYCLYRLGCKGPGTHANCSIQNFNEVGAWPVGVGHPCAGCTEQQHAFRTALFTTIEIERPTPPDTYPPIEAKQGGIGTLAVGFAGLVGGALLGAGYATSRKLGEEKEK
ncbi:MAG: hydrogenase small subunit [Acidobacteriota bacterium]